ncbi:MAG: YicC family protein [Phycisphaeraceae bacterium]|nr:YicC family protein [Phycisphaeraceae bacterium]
MIRSMTGFGDARLERGGVTYSLEVRSVNHRYLKATVRLPDEFAPLEGGLEESLRGLLQRGSVTVRCSAEGAPSGQASMINQDALETYLRAIHVASLKLGEHPSELVRPTIDMAGLLSLPGVLRVEPLDARLAAAREAFHELLPPACEGLVAMRAREGQALHDELVQLCGVVSRSLGLVRERAPEVSRHYEARLKARIEQMLPDAQPVDIVREVASYAERCDVNEEISRLGGHVEQFVLALEEDGPVGRKLDFIAQEMLREANTIASKSPDADISRAAIEAKAAIDRIKEQVQNVE